MMSRYIRYKFCKVESCGKVTKGKSEYCNMHKLRMLRHGDVGTIVRSRRIDLPNSIDYNNGTFGIPLTQDKVAIIDKDDLLYISQFFWHLSVKGYPARREKNEIIYMHQDIKGKAPKGFEIDHEDRNKLNNRKNNLIYKTHQQNLQNTERSENRKGIAFDRTHRKWKAYLDNPVQKRINIGTFKSKEDAEAALKDGKSK